MKQFSDMIARLRALHRAGKFQFAASEMTSGGPASERLTDLADFGANPGELRARFYVPEHLPPSAPLVVVLHGCTQTAADYDIGAGWSRLADEQGFVLLYPEQQRSNNPNLCFNWFVPADIRRDEGEAASIRQMIEALVRRFALDRRRIFVTGLSAGGAMAGVMLATYPEVFAGGAIIAGLPYGCARTVPQALKQMKGQGVVGEHELQTRLRAASAHAGPWPTLSIWQGDADTVVVPANAEAIIGQWREVHGVGRQPGRTEQANSYTRRVWSDASGREVIEAYTIAGMGHGTPLRVGGPDGLGRAAPFMLDVGISSTRRIAEHWGLTGAARRAPAGTAERPSTAEPASAAREPAFTGAEASDRGRFEGRHHKNVRDIIEDALRAAGLMK